MSNVRIELNIAGVEALRRSPEVKAMLRETAEDLAGKMGSGYAYGTSQGKKRARAWIGAVTQEAIQEEMEHNNLLRMIWK